RRFTAGDQGQSGRHRRVSWLLARRRERLMLKVTDAVVRYGSIEALHGVSFEVEQGEIVTLLGANGAGKSTTLRMISGLHAPSSGSVDYEGHDLTKVKAHELVG